MKTRVTELLGIEHPIILGGMAWVGFPPLVAAVSNAGGLGIIGAAVLSPQEMHECIRQTRELTDKPFGVNFIPDNPALDDLLDIIVEERVAMLSYGIGDPRYIIERTKPYGIVNMPTMGSLKHALKAEEDGADAVIVQGTEAGGHNSQVATMVLLPLVVDRVKIPVVAAGGFCDARGLVAALALGAEGISMGSRFVLTQESLVPQRVKQAILEATEEDTVVTSNFSGVRCRVLRNKLAEELLEAEKRQIQDRAMLSRAAGLFRKALFEGDADWGSVVLGQVCGRLNDIPTCREVIEGVVFGAERLLTSLERRINGQRPEIELKSP